jgi:phosphatidylserine synthase
MHRNRKIALSTVGTSLSVLCLTLSHSVRFAFPFASVDFTRGFFIGFGIVIAAASIASLVMLAGTGAADTQ